MEAKTVYELEDESLRYRFDNEIGVTILWDDTGVFKTKLFPCGWHEELVSLEHREAQRENITTGIYKRY